MHYLSFKEGFAIGDSYRNPGKAIIFWLDFSSNPCLYRMAMYVLLSVKIYIKYSDLSKVSAMKSVTNLKLCLYITSFIEF